MATLKVVALRLKSVKNIQKITQSMKMVSAAKYTRAERDLRAAKPYGAGAQTFFEVNIYLLPRNTLKLVITGNEDKF
jgi:F-type H+-transporting ATPase subunit gamma